MKPPEQALERPPEPHPGDWVRGEQLTMGDGQLGSELLDASPDRVNPEGTSYLAGPIDRLPESAEARSVARRAGQSPLFIAQQ